MFSSKVSGFIRAIRLVPRAAQPLFPHTHPRAAMCQWKALTTVVMPLRCEDIQFQHLEILYGVGASASRRNKYKTERSPHHLLFPILIGLTVFWSLIHNPSIIFPYNIRFSLHFFLVTFVAKCIPSLAQSPPRRLFSLRSCQQLQLQLLPQSFPPRS